MLLNEAPTLKVLIICKKLLNIMHKLCRHQLLDCVLSIVLIISLIKIIQKKLGILLERKLLIRSNDFC